MLYFVWATGFVFVLGKFFFRMAISLGEKVSKVEIKTGWGVEASGCIMERYENGLSDAPRSDEVEFESDSDGAARCAA